MQVLTYLVSFDNNLFTVHLGNWYLPLPIYEIHYFTINILMNKYLIGRFYCKYFIPSDRKVVNGGPSGIRTHDLSNANAVSYRTRRSAHDFDSDLHINILCLIMFLGSELRNYEIQN